MANPRKFSEKIALHNQKQAEETAAFEQIMREVLDATSRVPKQHLHINQSLGAYRGGSLPNVNSVDVKPGATQSVEMHPARPPDYGGERGRAGGGGGGGGGPIRQGRTAEKRVDTSPYNSNAYLSPPPDSSWRRTNSDSALHHSAMNTAAEATLRNAGSQRGGAYAAPGQLPGKLWHASFTDSQMYGFGDSNDPNRKFLPSPDGRPRSSCEVPRVPGINIYPSQQEPGTVQIPIGNNTGSLPDLTNFHFPSPLPNPLDHEDPNSSPYSTSPQGTSPSTLSPTSVSSRPTGRFSFGGGGGGGRVGSPQDSQGTSPGHSPSTRRRPYPQPHLQNLVLPTGAQPPVANHLSVPSLVNTRYLHGAKGIAVDSGNPLDSFSPNQYVFQPTQQQHQHQPQHQPQPQQQHQQQQQPTQQSPQQSPQPLPQQQQSPLLHQQSPQSPQVQSQHQPPSPLQQQRQPSPHPQPSSSPNLISNSQNISPQHLNSLNTYRSPPPPSRPSPQTSPGLTVQAGSLVYRSGSPGEASHSGPQSPVSPASPPGAGLGSSSPFIEHSNYGLSPAQAQALQQHFEQFSMVDNPVTNIGTYMPPQNNGTQYTTTMTHSPDDGLGQGSPQDLPADQVYFGQSPSQLPYNRPVAMNPSGGSTQQTTPQTPNTPSSIPDIILTDFSSNAADELSRQELVKELGSAISGTFDNELFTSDDSLREGLGSIDFEGFQMLTDPDLNAITDPATEDTFRMDRMDRL